MEEVGELDTQRKLPGLSVFFFFFCTHLSTEPWSTPYLLCDLAKPLNVSVSVASSVQRVYSQGMPLAHGQVVRIKWIREFPGGPMIRTQHPHCLRPGFDPWLGN